MNPYILLGLVVLAVIFFTKKKAPLKSVAPHLKAAAPAVSEAVAKFVDKTPKTAAELGVDFIEAARREAEQEILEARMARYKQEAKDFFKAPFATEPAKP